MSESLLVCPFCGGKARVHVFGFGATMKYLVSCDDCGVETAYCRTKKDVAKLWNRRV